MENKINLDNIDLNQIINGWTLEKILNNGGILLRNVNDEEQVFVIYMDTSNFVISQIKL